MNKVALHMPMKWHAFGVQIGIPYPQLQLIGSNHPQDIIRCFTEVFHTWENQATEEPYSWLTVIKALRSPSIGQSTIADDLEQELHNS